MVWGCLERKESQDSVTPFRVGSSLLTSHRPSWWSIASRVGFPFEPFPFEPEQSVETLLPQSLADLVLADPVAPLAEGVDGHVELLAGEAELFLHLTHCFPVSFAHLAPPFLRCSWILSSRKS